MSFKNSIISGCIISLIISVLIGYKIIQHSAYAKGIGLGIVLFMGAFGFWMMFIYFLSNRKYKSKEQRTLMCGVIFSLITIYTLPLVFADVLWKLELLTFPIQIIFLLLGITGFLITLSIFALSSFKD